VHNPDNAIVLYAVLVLMAFAFSKRFRVVRDVLVSGGTTVKAKAHG
jgi:hypothetical protein